MLCDTVIRRGENNASVATFNYNQKKDGAPEIDNTSGGMKQAE